MSSRLVMSGCDGGNGSASSRVLFTLALASLRALDDTAANQLSD